jgi:hypothetical protein|tara:strand:- start:47 stop:346 length:300 start_codon:yes stop_codon:yes gene_type:complete
MADPYKPSKDTVIKALDREFLMNDEKSIRDYARTVWDLIGNPVMIDEKVRYPYQRLDIPLGKRTRLTGERGEGLFGQWQDPAWRPTGEKDWKLTLTRSF